MQYGISLLSHIPCRADPSDKSEMVSQLLFGELYSILEVQDKWIQIRVAHDQYICWICIKQVHTISEELFLDLEAELPVYCSELVQIVQSKEAILPITIGATLFNIKGDELSLGDNKFIYQGTTSDKFAAVTKSKIIEDAFMYIGAPYLWGGRSPFGIDCSGFTQIVYKMNNVSLPRDASQQVEIGENYSFVEEAEPGDLAFFDNEEGNITHVGILLQDGKIIHASGKVRIDKLDHHGIFNEETGKYTHKLRIIKNIIPK